MEGSDGARICSEELGRERETLVSCVSRPMTVSLIPLLDFSSPSNLFVVSVLHLPLICKRVLRHDRERAGP